MAKRTEIRISVGAALAVLECVAERGEKLEPPPDVRIVVPRYTDALDSLVVRKYAKRRLTVVVLKTLDGPDNRRMIR